MAVADELEQYLAERLAKLKADVADAMREPTMETMKAHKEAALQLKALMVSQFARNAYSAH